MQGAVFLYPDGRIISAPTNIKVCTLCRGEQRSPDSVSVRARAHNVRPYKRIRCTQQGVQSDQQLNAYCAIICKYVQITGNDNK